MRRNVSIAVALALAALACNGGSSPSDGEPPFAPRTAGPLPGGSPPGVTSFGQTVPAEGASSGEVFPGQANRWLVGGDFALGQAPPGVQYDFALALYLGAPSEPVDHASLTNDLVSGALDAFPGDQSFSEIAFLTPVFTAADGVRTATASDGVSIEAPAIAGARSGYLNGTSDSRLSRTISVPPAAVLSLVWDHQVFLNMGSLAGADVGAYAPYFQVVLRDPATGAAIGAPLYSTATVDPPTPPAAPIALPPGLPSQVELSFEMRSAAGGLAVIDDVVLLEDGVPVASFANGDFEDAALSPWRANAGAESQNVRSGPRLVGPVAGPKLSVTRTFYAPPSAAWGRLVDVFQNDGSAPVSTTAVYATSLAGASPVDTKTAGGKAVVGWDASRLSRDVGFVHGTAGTAYVDAASNLVYAVHPITVPAGGRIALAHFVVQLGRAEGGLTPADVPAGTDAACLAILAGFRTDPQYAIDLEPGVLGAIANF